MDRLPLRNEEEPHPPVSVDCYVRATATEPFVHDVVETVHAYGENGVFEEYTVEFWPDELCLTGGRKEPVVLSRYRQLQAWADDEDVSLEPAFRRRERTSVVNETSETVLVLPVLCLAVRVRGELVVVAPHTTGTTPYTVGDALADIESLSRPGCTGSEKLPQGNPIRSASAVPAAEDRSADMEHSE